MYEAKDGKATEDKTGHGKKNRIKEEEALIEPSWRNQRKIL